MAVKLVENYIYFYHLDLFCVLPLYPDQITDTMKSTFASTNALSRSAPVFTYSNSGPREVTLTLSLHRDMMNDLNDGVSNLSGINGTTTNNNDYIDTLINYLLAAALPLYNAYSASIAGVVPPMVAVRFGNTMFVKGVVTSGIQVTYKKPIMADGKYACADISFTVSEIEPYDAPTVASVGSFRGISAGNTLSS